MSSTDKFLKLADLAGVPYKIYFGNRIDKGNGQGGCYWSGRAGKLFIWNKVKAIDLAHETAHYLVVEKPEQYSLNNYGLDLNLFNAMEQEKKACLLHFHLCNIFEVPRDEIESDMDNCSFFSEHTKEEVYTEAEQYSMMNHRDIILKARTIQGEQNVN